jgi:hypothetical protein
MPKFVIERQYLVPMYQHIVVEAENLEDACKKGISDDIDWDTQEMDSDGARKTTLTFIKEIPARLEESGGVLWDRSKNPDRPLAIFPVTFLYDGGHRPSSRSQRNLPATNNPPTPPSAEVEGARRVGAVRPSRSCRESRSVWGLRPQERAPRPS